MKRDMDLVRAILLKIEDEGTPEMRSVPAFGQWDEGTVTYHVRLLVEAGLVDAIDASTLDGEEYMQVGMTWHGHEFLEKVRDPEVWAKTKAAAAKAGSLSIGVLAEIAKGVIAAKLKSIGLGG